MKVCSKCGEEKKLSAFHERIKGTGKYRASCKVCHSKKRKKRCPKAQRNAGLKHKYGITQADYDRMYTRQNGRCAICDQPGDSGGSVGLVVDHNHKTGTVRSLLCRHCNTMLGLGQDSIRVFLNAANYLRKHYEP
jgi:hypothetical protein